MSKMSNFSVLHKHDLTYQTLKFLLDCFSEFVLSLSKIDVCTIIVIFNTFLFSFYLVIIIVPC